MDYLEERTTATADLILVNSLFTSRVFKRYFPTIKLDTRGMRSDLKNNPSRGENGEMIGGPRVVYPGINLKAYEGPIDHSASKDEGLKDLVS
jgi:alpha-1,3/alpha-1,6-mannosyltransferase